MKTQKTAWPQAHQQATSTLVNDIEALFQTWSNINKVGHGLHKAQNKKYPKTLRMRFREEVGQQA